MKHTRYARKFSKLSFSPSGQALYLLKKVSEIGYKVVQLSGIGNFTGEEVKTVLDKYGLICACTHRAPQNYLVHLDEEIEFHKTIGCNICGLGSMVEGIQSNSLEKGGIEIVERFAKNFGPVCKKLAKHGLFLHTTTMDLNL